MTTEQKAASDAVARLHPMEVHNIQILVALSAVRALIAAHPQPEKVRDIYEQLITQAIASPFVMGQPDKAIVLRDISATLFAPAVQLDT